VSSLVSKPIIVQPNAGLPRQINGRYFYMTSPDYMAKYARRYVELGATGVGGCCGTGPEHIRAIAQTLRMMKRKVGGESLERSGLICEPSGVEADVPASSLSPLSHGATRKSRILQKLSRGEKIISIELVSPKGTELHHFLESVEKIREAGISFVNVPDGARAATRVSSLHLAAYVHGRAELGMTIIPHFTTRDRNLIALQSDLLGASINHVHDILLVTGDPPKLGNNKDATGVYDIDSIGLTYLVHCLNQGKNPKGEPLGSQTYFGIGVAANPTALNLDLELSRWGYKVQSGADFAVTQPIYDPRVYGKWRESIQCKGADRPHLVGIWPFLSYRNAEFMAHEVPGVSVPLSILQRMERYKDRPKEAGREGALIAMEIMDHLWKIAEGFVISAPLGKTDLALEVAKRFLP
jgi:homocysteine S-methyltransferase